MHIFIELDLAEGIAHVKIIVLQILQNCLFLYLGPTSFGTICFILKFCLIQNIFYTSYMSAYINFGFLEICYILFDVGILFDELSIQVFIGVYI